jgi:hypothetical protein
MASHPPKREVRVRRSRERGPGGRQRRSCSASARSCRRPTSATSSASSRATATISSTSSSGAGWRGTAALEPRHGRAAARPRGAATMRAIQDEAKFVRESGWKRDSAPLLEKPDERDDGLDYIAKWKGKEPVAFSATIAAWGRTSEGAGHINCIAKLAEARLSARPADFDADPLLLNLQNGTLAFAARRKAAAATVSCASIARDRITKIGNAAYDPGAMPALRRLPRAGAARPRDARLPRHLGRLQRARPRRRAEDGAVLRRGLERQGRVGQHQGVDPRRLCLVDRHRDVHRRRQDSARAATRRPTSPRSPGGGWSMPTSPRTTASSPTA